MKHNIKIFVSGLFAVFCIAVLFSGNASASGVGGVKKPDACRIMDSYPKPSREFSLIKFYLPAQKGYKLSVYDVKNRLIKEYDLSKFSAGVHSVKWDASSLDLKNGMYVCELTDGTEKTMRIMMLRK